MTCLTLLAALFVLPTPSSAPLPNTESATNLPLVVQRERLRAGAFTLELDASPSNNFEIAVGHDANADGKLSLEETDVTFGYDCGVWFTADTATGAVTEESAPTTGRVTRTLTVRRRDWDPRWNRMKLVRRGTGEQNAKAIFAPDCPGMVLILR